MRRLMPTLLSLVATAACGSGDAPPPATSGTTPPQPSASATPTAVVVPTVGGHSIDLAAMDTSTKPGADFFLYANGAWYAKAEIPADRATTGVWLKATEDIEKRTKGILEEAIHAAAPAGTPTQKVADVYASYLDEAAIEARGVAPLAKELASISKIADKRELAAFLGSQIRADVDPLNATNFHTSHIFGLWVEQDLNDPTRYAPYMLQGGLGMPDRSYYVDDAAPMVTMRTKYAQHLATMLRLAKIKGADAKALHAMALETKIASVHATRVESEDAGKANNPWARADFATHAPGMDWAAFFAAAKLEKQPSIIVWHPHATSGISALVKSEPLDVWKDYLTSRAVERAAFFLNKALLDEEFAFYGTTLSGQPTPPPRWRRALDVTDGELGEAVGQMYVGRYFPPESKEAVKAIVANLLTAYGKRIDALTWMAPATKAKAKEKLATLKVSIGYPDTWRDYGALTIVKGDPLGNADRASKFEYERNLAKLGKPVDRDEWCMVPQEVNAVNLPIRNALDFPAGILVAPFFDPKSTPAANYGSIGAIIGHEISHSFDNEGAKFDAHGRFANWWTPDDLAHFQASGAALAAQFSTYHPFPDVAVNGEQTLSENIADLAGIAAAYDAWQASLGGSVAPTQDGLTGDQQFFLGFAQAWREKLRDEVMRVALATDGHAPPRYRALTVRNVDAWYPAFGAQSTDPLFLAPSARVRVW
jgi:putative endopeptidase